MLTCVLAVACAPTPGPSSSLTAADSVAVTQAVEQGVRAFHAADTARSAEGVIALLWPDFQMLGDGSRLSYEEVTDGSRDFMASLRLFHTEWTDLRIRPLTGDLAIASFVFRDSIITRSGDLIQSRGPTTFVWEQRAGQWRVLYADADHYPIR